MKEEEEEEEKEIKKTLTYQADTLFNACKNVKEEFIKAYGKPFLIIRAFLNGIIITIKRWLVYNGAIAFISNSKLIMRPSPDIEYIAIHSPLTLYDAAELYPLVQIFNISKEEIVRYACMYGGNVERIACRIRKEADVYHY